MKKFIVSLLATSMIIGLVGCASTGVNNNASTPAQTTPVQTDAPNQTDAPDETNAPSNNDDVSSGETLGNQLAAIFESEIANSTDLEAIANTLAQQAEKLDEIYCVVDQPEEGYLPGFTEDITGFKTCYRFAPMIGSIPFVGYVFEAEDAEGLKATLLSLADQRWQICTMAAETVCTVSGNYVFFTMCPGDESDDAFIDEF